MFSWKGSEREGACLRSSHLTSVGRGEPLTELVFPRQNMLTCENTTEALHLAILLNKSLLNSCALVCFIYLHFHCAGELMRIERSQRRVKDPEPGIIFISSVVDYTACCSLTSAVISSRYVGIY